ncbi:hypothetical protein C6500_09765 [Candidatus Poribacteria bacterium]|nr:MAG: hypothetical protein C6500_09765 [Candidatus Poribacteria bacterium]
MPAEQSLRIPYCEEYYLLFVKWGGGQPNGVLAVFRDDARVRRGAGSWERPTPVATEIVLSMLAFMCAFGKVVSFVKFCVTVGVEGIYSYNTPISIIIQIKNN